MDHVTYLRAKEAVRDLIRYIGDDPDRPGLLETPKRFLIAWEQTWGEGYGDSPPILTCFKEEGVSYNEMVIVRDMAFYSTCEHHLAPFFGTCDIAYIPKPMRGILGLSKLARLVDFYARRLQVQERLTQQIASHLAAEVSDDVAVVMRATHMCMSSRGVRQPNAQTITSVMKGLFIDAPTPRAEFLALVKPQG